MSGAELIAFQERLLGSWSGTRVVVGKGNDLVRSTFAKVLGGAFLTEEWMISGGQSDPRLRAIAYFSLSAEQPSGFVVAYDDGRLAFGESSLVCGMWVLLHRWIADGGEAEIRLHFADDGTYVQEVFEERKGEPKILVSRSSLRRTSEGK